MVRLASWSKDLLTSPAPSPFSCTGVFLGYAHFIWPWNLFLEGAWSTSIVRKVLSAVWQNTVIVSRKILMWLFKPWAELATFFMEYHLAWKEWLANYGYSDLVFGRHFHKNERSELAISRKTNDGFVVDDSIWILKQKLEFWKVIFSTTSFLAPSVSRLLMWLVVILKNVIWGYGVRRWVNIRRSAKLSWTNIFPMANPWCKNMNE